LSAKFSFAFEKIFFLFKPYAVEQAGNVAGK